MLRLRHQLPLALVLVAACGGSKSDEQPARGGTSPAPVPASTASKAKSPEEVARAFFEAVGADDRKRLEALFTDQARTGMASGEGFSVKSEALGAFEVGAATTTGDATKVPATVVLDGQEQDMRLLMRRESGLWRLHGFDVSIGGEGWMTIDLESIDDMLGSFAEDMAAEMAGALEESFSDWSQGGSEEDIANARARFESLRPITPAEHRAAWQVDVRATNRPAREVLATLIDGSGLGLDAGKHTATFAQPVTIEMLGVSRLEAIERVCHELGVHAVYPELEFGGAFGRMAEGMARGMGTVMEGAYDAETQAAVPLPTVTFAAGPRALPVAFAGPFLVEVAEIAERVPTTTGSLSLTVRALGLAPACMAYQTEMIELCAIDAIEGKQGQNLNGDDGVTFLSTPQTAEAYLIDRTQIDLKGLLRDVATIASVRGRVTLSIPVAIAAARTSAGTGPTKTTKAGSFEITPEDWGTYTTFDVVSAKDAAVATDAVEVRLSPIGADGAPMGSLMADSMPWGEVVRASLQTPAAPAHVDLKVCTVETLTYPFELKNLPLAQHARMPAELVVLGFDGPRPFEVEFVRFTKRDADFPEIELTIRNLSNKDATSVYAEFHYLDDAGTELESFQHTLTGTFGMDGVEPFAAGTSQTQRTTAFFMPAETHALRVVVTQIEFTDATTWSAAD